MGEGVTAYAVGDAAVTVRFTGGYREQNTGPVTSFAPAPAATREYLALASTGVSAMVALEQIGEVKTGETVAISAAAGGLGHLLVQLAVLKGCRVIGVAGGPEKCAFVSSLVIEPPRGELHRCIRPSDQAALFRCTPYGESTCIMVAMSHANAAMIPCVAMM